MQSYQETFEVGGSFIYGRADDLNRIVELLSSEDGANVNSTFVSIVSDRGTGRTTLLHLLHNALCGAFDNRNYICMPEKFDEMGLMRVIIESLTCTPCDITDLEILKEAVKEELMDQRLLLLLDNFENKSQKCWDLLSALLKVCKGKSAVVVTTTRKAIADVKGLMKFYYLNNLSDGCCSMVFKQCVFSGQNLDVDAELADIGKCLVAKCRFVTLCIKVLSGLLKNSITEDWWRVVLDSSFWEVDEVEGDILPALRVCYEYLPSHLKQCLKYCSLFPKEHIFSKKHLVRMWSSQGFIELCEGRDIEDMGLEYFDQLLSQSFFQPSLIPDMKKDTFVMPSLIHDMVQQLSKNECFQFEGCVQRAPDSICHLSLVAHEFRSVSLNHLITRAKNLKTFLVLRRCAFQHHISSCILNLVDLDTLFVKLHSLVTLNLNNIDIEELPETLGLLNNLRYLSLSGTNISRIPLEISNLIHLQTLEARECHYLEELPRTMEALTNLLYLDVTKEVGSVAMPHGIGKLTNLRSLATFNVGMDPLLHCGIEELKDMEHLKGCLEISGLINVKSGNTAKESHMRSKEHIETLFLNWWGDGKTFLEDDEGTKIAEEVLESLYPTDNLKEIIIRDYPGNSFPTWVECAHFPRLVSIILDHCYNCERLPDLGRLQSLKFLSIRKMYSVQKMNLSDSEYNLENNIRYPSLEQLTIWEMYELVEWVEIGTQDFPALQSLCINSCPLLRNIPKFPALVELSVYSCGQFLEAVDLQSLQSLRIEGVHKMKIVKLSKDLIGLKKFEISHCPDSLSIEGLSLLNSLETLIVSRCPQLGTHNILDGRLITFEKRGNTSLWLCKTKLASSDEGQDHPIVLNKREDREDLSSLSGVLADGRKKIKELDLQMSKEDQDLTSIAASSSSSPSKPQFASQNLNSPTNPKKSTKPNIIPSTNRPIPTIPPQSRSNPDTEKAVIMMGDESWPPLREENTTRGRREDAPSWPPLREENTTRGRREDAPSWPPLREENTTRGRRGFKGNRRGGNGGNGGHGGVRHGGGRGRWGASFEGQFLNLSGQELNLPPLSLAPLPEEAPAPFIPSSTVQPPFGAPVMYPEMSSSPLYYVQTAASGLMPRPVGPTPVFYHPPVDLQCATLLKQIEYYFSPDNLCKDVWLRSQMDEQGWVPIALIAGFPRVRNITTDLQFILETVQLSGVVEVQGDKIRKRGDLMTWILPPESPVTPSQSAHSTDNLTAQFQSVSLPVSSNQSGVSQSESGSNLKKLIQRGRGG